MTTQSSTQLHMRTTQFINISKTTAYCCYNQSALLRQSSWSIQHVNKATLELKRDNAESQYLAEHHRLTWSVKLIALGI